MNEYNRLLEAYLAFRRTNGYGLARAEKLLHQFGSWLDGQPSTGQLFTQAQALTWASLPGGSPSWQHHRLGVVRGLALWLDSRDLPVGVPSLKVLPRGGRRAIPYQYDDTDITALMAACDQVFSPFRAATMRTLTGMLAVTGLRIGEAIGLDTADLDLTDGRVQVRDTKSGRDRLVFLKPTSCQAVASYLDSPLRPAIQDPAVFVSLAGTRLLYCNVSEGFLRMRRACHLQPQPGATPRLHDLRHRFATNTIAAAYAPGALTSPERTLTLLSTWLGHADPAHTYWYLEASPRLLALAATRLEPGDGCRP